MQNDKTSNEESKLISAEDSDTFDVEANFVHVKNPTAFSQRKLVARAFANDNVIEVSCTHNLFYKIIRT